MFHDTSALFLLLLICFNPFIRVSTARPTADPPSGSLPFPQPSQLQSLRAPRSHGRNTQALSPTVGASMFEKRTPPDSTSSVVKMNMMTFKAVASMLPLAEAARYLENFYSSVAASAAGAWQASPRQYSFSVNQGPFSLDFTSMGDSIPWEFVREMAERLWQCTRAGMADLFEVIYMDDAGKIAVAVSLRFADGDGSFVSAGTDYREGSVPSIGSPYD